MFIALPVSYADMQTRTRHVLPRGRSSAVAESLPILIDCTPVRQCMQSNNLHANNDSHARMYARQTPCVHRECMDCAVKVMQSMRKIEVNGEVSESDVNGEVDVRSQRRS